MSKVYSFQYASIPYPEFDVLPEGKTRFEKCHAARRKGDNSSRGEEEWHNDFRSYLQPIGRSEVRENTSQREGDSGCPRIEYHPGLLWIWLIMACFH